MARRMSPAPLGKTGTLFGYPTSLCMRIDGYDYAIHGAIVVNTDGTASIDLDKVIRELPNSTEKRLERLERHVGIGGP